MAVAFVQAAANNAASGSSLQVTISPAAGNTLVVVVGFHLTGETVSSITDNGGSTYLFRNAVNNDVTECKTEVWSTPPNQIASGVTTVTINLSGSINSVAAECGEYSGVDGFGRCS